MEREGFRRSSVELPIGLRHKDLILIRNVTNQFCCTVSLYTRYRPAEYRYLHFDICQTLLGRVGPNPGPVQGTVRRQAQVRVISGMQFYSFLVFSFFISVRRVVIILTTLFGNLETLRSNRSLLYQTPHRYLRKRKYIRNWCPLGLKRMYDCCDWRVRNSRFFPREKLVDFRPEQFYTFLFKLNVHSVYVFYTCRKITKWPMFQLQSSYRTSCFFFNNICWNAALNCCLSSERRPARSDLVVLVAHNDDPTDQMFVFFPDDPKIGIKTIKTYCTRNAAMQIQALIIKFTYKFQNLITSHLVSKNSGLTVGCRRRISRELLL